MFRLFKNNDITVLSRSYEKLRQFFTMMSVRVTAVHICKARSTLVVFRKK